MMLEDALKAQKEENELDKKTVNIRTICRDCIFATFEENKQVGCTLDRLKKFQDKNIVQTIYDPAIDAEYYEIQAFCNTCRNETWSGKYENPIEKVLKEISIKLDFVIIPDVTDPNLADKLVFQFEKLIKQTLSPKKIIVVLHKHKGSLLDLTKRLNDLVANTGITYELVNVIVDSVPEKLIDFGLQKSYAQYYTMVDLDKALEVDFIEKLNKLLNFDLVSFSMIEPQEGTHGLTIQRLLHTTIGGNNFKPVTEKIKELAHNQNVPHMIKEFKDI